ncbi:MAG: hypothetical protein P4L79_10525 [Legionella sp.]|uniref:hypothetical protein n=1 Tax=Legionella sp. TaxID=459 RepID=UPI00283D4396|nr:hypothetical protein [Legionella sp.]
MKDKIRKTAERTRFFNHLLLPQVNITNEDTSEGRYYTTPSGVFPSVTTRLGKFYGKEFLEQWRNRVGHEKAERITYQAGLRGTAVHNICERYLRNEPDYLLDEPPANAESFRSIQKFLDDNVGDVYGIELPLYSKFFNTAGRTDLLGSYAGQKSVIDFKTTRNEKREDWIESYFVQETVYALMVEEMYGVKIPQIVTIMASDYTPPLIFVKDKSDYVAKAIEIFC